MLTTELINNNIPRLQLHDTVAKALQFLTHGYDVDPAEILKSAMFKEETTAPIAVRAPPNTSSEGLRPSANRTE